MVKLHNNPTVLDFSFILNNFHYIIILFIVETHKNQNSRMYLPPRSSKTSRKEVRKSILSMDSELRSNDKNFLNICQTFLNELT